MINANEARELSKKALDNKHKKDMERIEVAINKAVENGETSATLYSFSMTDEIMGQIIRAGYKIAKEKSGFNEYATVISW